MDSFFSSAELSQMKPSVPRFAECEKCGLFRECQSPKMPAFGRGREKILIVGEAPGKDEDSAGRPFVGRSGGVLAEAVAGAGFDLDRDCVLDNACRCRPPDNKLPKERVIDFCRPNMLRTVREVNPRIVLLLGKSAVKSFLAHYWRAKGESFAVERWNGWHIPLRDPNCWVCPTYHPAFAIHSERDRDYDLKKSLFTRQVKEALALPGRPWADGEIPDERKSVDYLLDDRDATDRLAMFHDEFRQAAFDFETTTLKPDGPYAEIVSCSVSSGVDTFAFPWAGKVVAEMKHWLMDSKVRKIGQNAKFEQRWCLAKLGIRVRGWEHDDMLASHGLDARRGITGVKFQAFVLLGTPDYSSRVQPYLESSGGCNAPNRIRELDLPTLLEYNAMDSLVEYRVWEVQRRAMKS